MGTWIAIAVFITISVILFCCVRAGARADREMEKIFKKDE